MEISKNNMSKKLFIDIVKIYNKTRKFLNLNLVNHKF